MYHPAGMRRAGPILIILIGVLALMIDFFPGLQLPDPSAEEGAWRPVVTKLGLDHCIVRTDRPYIGPLRELFARRARRAHR